MAREKHPDSTPCSGGLRRTVAAVAAVLIVASAVAHVSVAAAVGTGDRAPVVASVAGNTDDPTVGNDEAVTIRGTVTRADGTAANDATVRLGSTDENRTDERGRYRLRGESGRSYDLTYRQNASESAARDGAPAVYAVERVTLSENATRNVSLPEAGVLNVTVEARNGTAVPNATVRFTHAHGGANATVTGRTDERGRVTVDGRVGVELAGNVTVAVEAPNATLADATETVTVSNATDERVVLPHTDAEPPEVRYDVWPRPVNVSDRVTFDARGSTDGESGIRNVTWTVGGQPVSASTVTDTFGEPGNYTVNLSVTDWAGNENATEVSIRVVDERPPEPALAVAGENGSGENATTADANATTLTVGESVTFDANDTTDNHRVAEYRWDLDGNGTAEVTTDDPTVRHTYTERGRYEVTVTAVDETGNRANATLNVTVEAPPNASFAVSDSRPDVGERVQFDAAESRAVGNASYEWTFEGGPSARSDTVVTTGFPEEGTYDVTLTVTDGRNRTDSLTRTVTVDNRPPEASAGANRTVVAGETVALNGSGSDDPDDAPAYRWTQTAGPDANLSNRSRAVASFVAPAVNDTAVLRFELNVTDDQTESDADAVTIRVVPDSPPGIAHRPRRPAVDETVTFEVNRTGRFRWDFDGDGRADARNATATHRFDSAGDHEVTLTDGANRTVTRTVTVFAPPEASAAAPENATAGERVRLDGSATDASANATYRWTQTGGPDANLSNRSRAVASFVAPNPNRTSELTFELWVSGPGGEDTVTVGVTVPATNGSDTGEGSDAGTGSGGDGTSGETGGESGDTGGESGDAGGESGDTGDKSDGSTGGAASGGSTGGAASGGSTGDTGTTGATGSGGAPTPGGSGSDATGGTDADGAAGDATGGSGSVTGSESASESTGTSGSTGASESSGSTGGDTGASETDRPAAPSERPVSVTVEDAGESAAANGVVASVEHADRDDPARVELPADFGTNGTTYASVSVVPNRTANFSLGVDAVAERPDGTPRPDAAGVLSYLSVHERGIDDAGVETARFRFRVTAATLERRGVSPDAVRLYHYDGESWETLATSVVGKRDGAYRFEAVSPGFSVFAVGVADSQIAVTGATLGADSVATGESVTVTATVENGGRVDGSVVLALTANGSAIAQRRVSVPADATRTVEFARSFDAPGRVKLGVRNASAGSVAAGTLSVTADETNETAKSDGERGANEASSGDESSASASGSGDSSGGGSGDSSGGGSDDSSSGGFGFSNGKLFLGLFVYSLVAAGLWGYLLS